MYCHILLGHMIQGGPKKLHILQHTISLEPFTNMFPEFLGKDQVAVFMLLLDILYT